MLEKLSWFHVTNLLTLVLLIWKWMGPFLRKNNLLRCWGWLCLPNWIEALTLFLLLKLSLKYWNLALFYKISFSWGCSASLINLPCGHGWNNLVFYRYYFGRCSSVLAELVPLPYSWGKCTCFSDRLHDFSVTIPCYKDVYVNHFFLCTGLLDSRILYL